MVVQILGGRRPKRSRPAVAHPVAEGQPGRRGPVGGVGLADAHQPGVQGVGRPRVARVPVRGRRPGPARIHVGPHLLTGRAPAGGPTLAQRRVGERRHQHRSDRVQQTPARPVPRFTGAVVARVQADLNRRGAAHHLTAPRAVGVEEFLHRRVPRQVDHTPGRAQWIKAIAAEFEAGRCGCVTQGGQIPPGHLNQFTKGDRGRRAQLKLPARLHRQGGTRGKSRNLIPNDTLFVFRVALLAGRGIGPEGG